MSAPSVDEANRWIEHYKTRAHEAEHEAAEYKRAYETSHKHACEQAVAIDALREELRAARAVGDMAVAQLQAEVERLRKVLCGLPSAHPEYTSDAHAADDPHCAECATLDAIALTDHIR